MKIDKNLDNNIKYLEDRFADCGDVVKRKFPVGENKNIWCYIIYIDVLTSKDSIDETIMKALIKGIRQVKPEEKDIKGNIFNTLINGSITTADFKETTDINQAINEILMGNTLLLVDGCEKAIIASTKGFPKRGIDKPDTEVAIQGSKESFNEAFRVNTVLIRRRIRDTNLKVKQMNIGRRSNTDVALMYLKDVVRESILQEVEKRLKDIDIDAILDSGYIEQLIEDDWKSPFPQIQLTERPDKAAAAILEGRIVIVVDNTPFVLIVPAIFASFYQASDDYYQRWEISSFVRILRYIAGFIAISLPGLYIATTVYHPSMIPMLLVYKMAEARQSVPIPIVVEVLIMELAFETLREASIRLPGSIGNTLGIIGGIIVGTAAVDAGLVSPMVVIVISLTGICSFAIPNIALVAGFRLMKYIVILFSSILGLFGYWIAILLILLHLVTLRSFGIPYTFPFSSSEINGFSDIKDTIFRVPIFMMGKRPIFSNPNQKIRLNSNRKKRRKN